MNDRKLPLYTRPRQVRAAKITKLHWHKTGSATITPEGNNEPFVVGEGYMIFHKPRVGGYFIQHANGNQTFLSAPEFEAEHTLAEQDA